MCRGEAVAPVADIIREVVKVVVQASRLLGQPGRLHHKTCWDCRGGASAVPQGDKQQREVHYGGDVQGVGFRYTVRSLAARFDVTGFVRNLPDGRVQLVVEGAAAEIDAFLAAIKSEMQYYIGNVQEIVRPGGGRFPSFEIRH